MKNKTKLTIQDKIMRAEELERFASNLPCTHANIASHIGALKTAAKLREQVKQERLNRQTTSAGLMQAIRDSWNVS